MKPLLWPSLLPIGVAALAGGVMFWNSTQYGVGLGFDSIHYIAAARSLVAGEGLGRYNCIVFKPLTLWPPLYPIALAIISLFRSDPIAASRILGALGYSLTILLGGVIAGLASRSILSASLATGLLLLSAPLLQVSSWAMSEQLFLPLALASILYLGLFLEGFSTRDMLLACLFTALATLTRYVGIVLCVVGALTIMICGRSLGKSLRLRALLFAVCSLAPIGFWFSYNAAVVGSATNRRLAFHPPAREELALPADTIANWFIPDRLNAGWIQGLVITCLVIIVLTALVWYLKSTALHSAGARWALVLCLLAMLYPLIILASDTFLTPGILEPLGDRLLILLHVTALILVAIGTPILWRNPSGISRSLALAIGIAMVTLYSVRYPGLIRALSSDGQGFASPRAAQSATAQALRLLDEDMIYTNDIQAMYFLADKRSCAIPTAGSDSGLEEMRANLHAWHGVVVIFGRLTGEFQPIDQVIDGLDMIQILPEAVVYGLPPSG